MSVYAPHTPYTVYEASRWWSDGWDCLACQYSYWMDECSDCIDCTSSLRNEVGYELIDCESCHTVFYAQNSRGCSDVAYCSEVHYSKNCFGCANLHHKQYCILNQQYSAAGYNQLLPKIIAHMQRTGEWGEFFPPQISPFAYNETSAQTYFPRTEEQAAREGLRWRTAHDSASGKEVHAVSGASLPQLMEEADEAVLAKPICCPVTKRLFKFTRQELAFYREHHLPPPALHPDERHRRRMEKRNRREMHTRSCSACSTIISTGFGPSFLGRVLCEGCFLKERY